MTGTRGVGEVAALVGVTVRTLHHYDEVGLVSPARTPSGHRLYTGDDVVRLRHVVVYRRLGFALEEIAVLLDDPHADVVAHLRRQRSAVTSRLDEMRYLVVAIDRALEAEMSGTNLTAAEQRELFGESFSDEFVAEAQERWGDTDAWRQSRRRTASYTKDDWARMKTEQDAVTAAFLAALQAGEPATSERAMDAAATQRAHITRWFYDLDPAMHRDLADLYVVDDRYARAFDVHDEGLRQYVRDAVHADVDRRS